jgi:hypothetical protein
MAKTIPQLTDATTVNAADELIIQQGGITKRATGAELAKGLNAINGIVNVQNYGAVGDGVADDTAAIQAAIIVAQQNGSSVHIPAGKYQLSSTLNVTSGVRIYGEYPILSDSPLSSLVPPSKGTWLYINHNGVGINVNANNNVTIENIGTYRPSQTLPVTNLATPYVPVVQQADIKVTFCNNYFFLKDALLLNPYIGVEANGTGGNVLERLFIGAIHCGISIDTSYDSNYINDIHIWAFWTGPIAHNLWKYTLDNATGILLKDVHGPILHNVFTIFCRRGMELGAGVNGPPLKLQATNLNFDRGGHGIYVSGDNTSAWFQNVAIQGETITPVTTNVVGIVIDADACLLYFDIVDVQFSGGHAITATANASTGAVYAENLRVFKYGVFVPAAEALHANNAAFEYYLDGSPSITEGGGGAAYAATLKGLGWSFNDVTLSRSTGVAYTNTSNKPMAVCMFGQNTSGSVANTLFVVNGQQVQGQSVANGQFCTFFHIVPPQQTYEVQNLNTVSKWIES